MQAPCSPMNHVAYLDTIPGMNRLRCQLPEVNLVDRKVHTDYLSPCRMSSNAFSE